VTDKELARIARRAALARLGMDAYATAVEEIAAEQAWPDAWAEADAIRELMRDVPRLLAEVRRLRVARP
jgi:hypothetical protein